MKAYPSLSHVLGLHVIDCIWRFDSPSYGLHHLSSAILCSRIVARVCLWMSRPETSNCTILEEEDVLRMFICR